MHRQCRHEDEHGPYGAIFEVGSACPDCGAIFERCADGGFAFVPAELGADEIARQGEIERSEILNLGESGAALEAEIEARRNRR